MKKNIYEEQSLHISQKKEAIKPCTFSNIIKDTGKLQRKYEDCQELYYFCRWKDGEEVGGEWAIFHTVLLIFQLNCHSNACTSEFTTQLQKHELLPNLANAAQIFSPDPNYLYTKFHKISHTENSQKRGEVAPNPNVTSMAWLARLSNSLLFPFNN